MRTVAVVFVLFILNTCLVGCGDNFFDPTQIGRFRPMPAVNVILDSLGVAEETSPVWEAAEEPRPIDVMVLDTDYVFSSGDYVRVFIFELLQEGVLFRNDYIVTETGKISIPDVGVVEAAGLTESQLEEEIKDILTPGILKEPSVTVTLLSSQQRTFSILGNGVPQPGRYPIPRYDYRLTDALAEARVATQFNISYIYISRSVTGREAIGEPIKSETAAEPEQLIVPEREMLEIIAPTSSVVTGLVIASAEMVTDKELAEAALPEGFEPLPVAELPVAEPTARETIDEPINEGEAGRIEWIFQDGRWVPVRTGRPGPAKPAPQVKWGKDKAAPDVPGLEKKVPEDFDWDQIGAGGVQTRVIKIPTDRLSGGDARYDIVIRPGDSIHVPVDIIGEFCIMGNTNYQGYIDITGRPLTLKMAIAAAGGLGPYAWPKRCEVVRRVGRNKEEIVMVDLDKIATGEQPDFFIKPNDLINVGTHPTARWRAILRNAFRATYGFGFIYDRNFGNRDFGTRRPIPNWF